MRVHATFLVGLIVGVAGCAADDPTSFGAAGNAGSGGSAGSSMGGSAGSSMGGSAAGGSGGSAGSAGTAGVGNAGAGGMAAGGTGGAGATGGVGATGGAATGGVGGVGGTDAGGTGGVGATGGAGATGGVGATGGAATGGTSGGTSTCTAITTTTFTQVAANAFQADINPELGGALVDVFQLEFYSPAAGSQSLASPPDDNYATCARCVRVFEDATETGVARQYYQASGTMNLSAADGSAGSLSGVTLVEVTVDSAFNTTPVAGGRCLTLASASWAAAGSCTDGGTEYTGATACDDCQADAFSSGGCCSTQADACSSNASCGALITCLNACPANDTACVNSCASTHAAGVDDALALVDCVFGPTDTDVGACGTACQ